MKTTEKHAEPIVAQEKKSDPLKVFIDGAGSRPDGAGSGFAWICATTGERKIERVPGLTNNQAEYRAFIAALTALPGGSWAEFFSDSQLLCCQFNGQYKVKDLDLADFLAQAHSLIKEKNLIVTLQWVPRAKNTAGKLL
jgi:ribonuclease HI